MKHELSNSGEFQWWCHHELGLMVHEALGPRLLTKTLRDFDEYCRIKNEYLEDQRENEGRNMPLTKEEFESLKPQSRGWAVYMAGRRDDQPNVPDEKNPYPVDSEDNIEWSLGQQKAMLETQDIP